MTAAGSDESCFGKLAVLPADAGGLRAPGSGLRLAGPGERSLQHMWVRRRTGVGAAPAWLGPPQGRGPFPWQGCGWVTVTWSTVKGASGPGVTEPPSDLVRSAYHLHLAEDTGALAAESLGRPVGRGRQQSLGERTEGDFRLKEGEVAGEGLAGRSQRVGPRSEEV